MRKGFRYYRMLGREWRQDLAAFPIYSFERGQQKVCNLSQGVYNSGYVNGYINGYIDGYIKGYNDGVKKAAVQRIVLVMKGKNMDIEECLDIFQIPEEKRDEYRESVMAELGLTI